MTDEEERPTFTIRPFSGWPWWLQMIGGAAVGIVALFSAGQWIDPYQPFATKTFVVNTINQIVDKKLQPVVDQQLTAQAERSDLQNRLYSLQNDFASVSVASLTYQIAMMQQQLTRLDMVIASGLGTDNDRQLAEALRDNIRISTDLRAQVARP